jgi:serine phosphatase RsbU (regulator of sigma subunit)
LPNAAILRALDSSGRIEVIASRSGGSAHDRPNATFSRSLLTAASNGTVAEMSGNSDNAGAVQASISQSMVQMKIDAAICAPLMLGSTVAAYLYLDSRGNSPGMLRTLRPNASGFCLALAKIAGLALANLKRIVVERRAATMEAELNAAATAQKWILPKGQTRSHSFVCVGDSRPGQYLGGDFFDAMVLPDGRLLVSLGDVSGHGIAASVLMTASQGYLHAALTQHADLARAVTDLNAFIHPRRPESKFITLWAGVFDPKTMSVSYIDAGHGYAMMEKTDGTFEALSGGEGVPVGILPDFEYKQSTAKLPAGGRVLIISDGIIEQTEGDPTASPRRQFELEGVQDAIRGFSGDQDVIERLFQAVYKFAGGTTMADDTTAVLVKW